MSDEPIRDDHQFDPELDAMLDEALSPPQPPAGLTDRLLTATRPQLGRRSVVARIGPRLAGGRAWRGWSIAAMVLIVVGAGVWMSLMRKVSGITLEDGLDEVAAADVTRDTLIDHQLDLLALQVDLARADAVWLSTEEETFEEAIEQYELESFATDVLLLF